MADVPPLRSAALDTGGVGLRPLNLRGVQAGVLAAGDDQEIFESIVCRVAVYVVDLFVLPQRTTEVALDDPPIPEHFAAVEHDAPPPLAGREILGRPLPYTGVATVAPIR